MARKQGRGGRQLSRLFCGAMTLLLLCGCSHFQDTSPFTEANDLFSKGNYSASLEKYEQIGKKLPAMRDRVLFEKGVILAHPKNGQRDYPQALGCFQQLVREFPESPYRQNSETMIFTISNVVLKDATIATQQAQIDTLRCEIAGRGGEIAALQENITALNQKVFVVATRNGAVDRILIEKGERRLTLFAKGEAVKTYRIALGGNPIGPKERQGDNKTPEGTYVIDARNMGSSYHLSLHISYPNEKDKKRARELGVSPGGDIMIHGVKNGFSWVGNAHAEVDWTKGCIAVTDEEIEEIARVAPNGTVVEIRP
jgi:L,D-peptidoglycan transpeptidase YkuD (ErfK/YbiS/YcfS/YnhG family)